MKVEVIWKENRPRVGIDGEWRSFRSWCQKFGINYAKARSRIYIGWPMEEALELVPHVVLPKEKKAKVRVVSSAEKKKRGCMYCVDNVREENSRGIHVGRYCPHDKCPYSELDKYDDYEEYMKATDLSSFAKALAGLGLTEEEEDL